VDLDLSKNEGLLPRLPSLAEEISTLSRRYPETGALRRAVARRHGVEPSRVLPAAGGDDALFRCFLQLRGGRVVATTPSFEMIPVYASQTGASLTQIPWWTGAFPTEEFITAGEGAEMAVVVSPNNPTGAAIDADDLRRIASVFPRVVLDAAYAEFADEDLTPLALELENVVVIRTLSKAFGLAGLRVGYLLGSPESISQVGSYGSPYPISGPSASLATGVLSTGDADALSFVTRVREERERLVGLLDELDAKPLPTQANFVLASDVDPEWLVAGAASLGVGLRCFPDTSELSRSVRITLPGDPEGYRRLEHTLRTVLAPEGLIFDLDGVIADVGGSYRAAIVETAAAFGVTVTAAQIAAAKAAGDANDDWELTRRLCAAAGVDLPLEAVQDRFEELYQGSSTRTGLREREELLVDRDLLEAWASRLPLGVVTGRPRRDAETFLERFGLAELFRVVVTREDAPMKPDPAPVRLTLERLGVRRAWMLGDTRDDIEAARGAGVLPLGVATPYTAPGTAEALSGAALILEDTNQLEEVLNAQAI
jgi:histidinol-phosphate aminotransferase